jgi:hypothetical protein
VFVSCSLRRDFAIVMKIDPPESSDHRAGLCPNFEEWRPLWKTLVESSSRELGENLPGEFRLVTIDGQILPMLIPHPRQPAADVCSPVSRYSHYPLVEIRKRAPSWRTPLFAAAATAWAGLLTGLQIDWTVQLNNHLLTTNPAPRLTESGLRGWIREMRAEFPRHTLLFRTVIPTLESQLAETLQSSGARMVPTRVVNVIDPTRSDFERHANVRRDRALLRQTPYHIRGLSPGAPIDAERIVELYRTLYLDKHGPFNAAFNRRFFEALLATPAIRWAFWESPATGRIDAFSSWFRSGGSLTSMLVGYDRSLPAKLGLYRMALMYPVFHEAQPAGLPINLSGGATSFKQLRGAQTVREYDAVWDRHLPAWRRLPWHLVTWEGQQFGRRELAASPPGTD